MREVHQNLWLNSYKREAFFVSTMAIDWKSVLESCVITLAVYAIDQLASWASETWKLTLLTLVSLPAAQSRCFLKICGNEWRMEIFVHKERWEPLIHVLCCCTTLNFLQYVCFLIVHPIFFSFSFFFSIHVSCSSTTGFYILVIVFNLYLVSNNTLYHSFCKYVSQSIAYF